MSVWTLGINHNTAPLDLRGRFAFAIDQIQPTLQTLRSSLPRQPEATLLSTCNRTELYGAGDHAIVEPTLEWLAQTGGVSPQVLREHAYVLRDDQAARHAFRVASGLDSMVLGEAQILGQMKNAVRAADEAGALGSTLHQLFQRSFAVAKQVRTSTEIGAHSISMAAASVRLAAQLFEDLEDINFEDATLFPDTTLYASRLVQDRDGGWNLIAFINHVDGRFIGELCDPIPVTADPILGLVPKA